MISSARLTIFVPVLLAAGALVGLGLPACASDDEPAATGQAGSSAGGGSGTASCTDVGTATTRTPTCDGSDTTCNVVPLACTRTAQKLGCELGTSHRFETSVANGVRTLSANGIPNHDVGDFPNAGNPNTISAQTYTYTVPVTPAGTGGPSTIFGLLASGVVLDPGTAETWNDDASWRYEALRYGSAVPYFSGATATDKTFHPDALGVDCNLAHVQPTGSYHYHGVPTSLVPAAPAVVFAGWAADGYPITLLYGHADPKDAQSPVREMVASYRLKTGDRPAGSPGGAYDGTFGQDWAFVEGSGDLDACNGHVGPISIDGQTVTTYHYVLTNTFPYIPRCTTAAADASFAQKGPAPGMGGTGAGGGTGAPGACTAGQTSMCCGDGVCDGPETKATCPADCPLAPSSAAFGRVDEAVRSKAVPCRLALFDLETRDRTRLVWPSLQSTECDGNARRPTATLCGSAHRNDLARRP